MNLQEARQFVAQFVKGDHTPEEYATFLRWLRGATLEELTEIAGEHEALHEHWDVMGLTPTAEWKARLEEKLDQARKEEDVPVVVIGENEFGRRTIVRHVGGLGRSWVAAASVTVLLAGGAAIWYSQKGGVKVERSFQLPLTAKTAVNPRGGAEKELVLADGSKVMLNVASELKYPESFDGSERVVELSGEAYFEVTPNAAKPFRVLTRDGEVDVLGTSFNVRAYADEPVSKTTLIDGSVAMVTGSNRAKLHPGQQAVVAHSSSGQIDLISKVDIESLMAWRRGYFRFTNEEINTVIRVLSRYYNVDIQCDLPGRTITGSVSRDKTLDENLEAIKAMGYHIIVEGKTKKVTL